MKEGDNKGKMERRMGRITLHFHIIIYHHLLCIGRKLCWEIQFSTKDLYMISKRENVRITQNNQPK